MSRRGDVSLCAERGREEGRERQHRNFLVSSPPHSLLQPSLPLTLSQPYTSNLSLPPPPLYGVSPFTSISHPAVSLFPWPSLIIREKEKGSRQQLKMVCLTAHSDSYRADKSPITNPFSSFTRREKSLPQTFHVCE